MRTLPIIGAAAISLVVAGATIAASPSPTPLPSAKPTTPAPSATPSSPPTTSGTSSNAQGASGAATWTAAIKPIDTTSGMATFVKHANGTGTLTLTLHGLRPDQPWSVDVDGGTAAQPIERAADEIAFRSGMGVAKVSSDTVRIQLTRAEMRDFVAAQAAKGVDVIVSDGANRAEAVLPAA
jgi:hypothetical protein